MSRAAALQIEALGLTLPDRRPGGAGGGQKTCFTDHARNLHTRFIKILGRAFSIFFLANQPGLLLVCCPYAGERDAKLKVTRLYAGLPGEIRSPRAGFSGPASIISLSSLALEAYPSEHPKHPSQNQHDSDWEKGKPEQAEAYGGPSLGVRPYPERRVTLGHRSPPIISPAVAPPIAPGVDEDQRPTTQFCG